MSELIKALFAEPDPEESPRARLARLTQAMQALPETFEPALSHYRTTGLYGRRIYVPAGMCVATRVHLEPHLTVALAGECWVVDQEGRKAVVSAPAVFVTEPGTQRACWAQTDVQWLTVHAADIADVSSAMAVLTCGSFEEYEDRVDYQAVLTQYALTEPEARAVSERSWDQSEGLPSGVSLRSSSRQGLGVFAVRAFQCHECIGVARDRAMRTALGRYANHGRSATMRFEAQEDGGLVAFAVRAVLPGEELTVDYRQAREAADSADRCLGGTV